MSWLRLDDGFARHTKVLELSEVKRWRWVELLCDCARLADGGKVSAGMLRAVSLSASELVALGLLDEREAGSWRVHDWDEYNGGIESQANRQRRYRLRKAGVPEAEVMQRAPLKWEGAGGTERDVTRDVTDYVSREPLPVRAHSPTPNPSKDGTAQEGSPYEASASDEEASIWAGELAADVDVARLLELLEPDAPMGEHLRGLALRSPALELATLSGELLAGVPDPLSYAIERLRSVAT